MNVETLEELISEILPDGFRIELNKHKQVVIYTNLTCDDDGELVSLTDESEMEDDLDEED